MKSKVVLTGLLLALVFTSFSFKCDGGGGTGLSDPYRQAAKAADDMQPAPTPPARSSRHPGRPGHSVWDSLRLETKSHGGGILNNLLDLLTKLIPLAGPLVPGAGPAPEIAAAVAALIRHIQQQSGKTTDQILADADATLDDTEKRL